MFFLHLDRAWVISSRPARATLPLITTDISMQRSEEAPPLIALRLESVAGSQLTTYP